MKQLAAKFIGENTMIPISMVITLLSCVVGGAVWATQVHFTQASHTKKLDKIESIQKDISTIKESLARIEGRLQ